MMFVHFWLKNQYVIYTFYLLSQNIGMNFHKKLKTAETYLALELN